MKIDFHVHTNHSVDSIIKPSDLILKSKKLGIIPAITDHNTIGCHTQMQGIKFIPGEEIRTDRGDLIGLYLNEKIPRKTLFMEALDNIREQGGIVYLPHMYDRPRCGAVPDDIEIKKIDIVEVFNSRCLNASYNEKAELFADSNNLLKAAGSDAHFLFEFGRTYTELPEFDLNNPKELLKSLKQAKLITRKAPFYVRGTTTLVKFVKKLL